MPLEPQVWVDTSGALVDECGCPGRLTAPATGVVG